MTLRSHRTTPPTSFWRSLPCLGALLAILAAAAFAEPRASLKPTGYVNDFAGVLSADTRSQLESYCYQVEQKTQAQIAVVTIKSLDGEDIEGYANGLYRQWGIGDKKEKRGVLVLFAINDHKYRVEVGYGLEPILPDGKVGGFGREAVPFLKQNDYDGAVQLMTQRIGSVITGGDAGTTTGADAQDEPAPQSSRQGTHINPFLLIIGAIIFLIMICTRTGRAILFWWLLTGGGRGGGSGWGGGSFGGGGGGGGFSGFGGGDSGGGGASGSW